MNDGLWFVLLALAAVGAYREFMNAWFLYQVRKRRRADVSARVLRLVINHSVSEKDIA